MSQSNGDIIRSFVQKVWEDGNYSVLDEMLSEDFSFYSTLTQETKDKLWYTTSFVPTMRDPFSNTRTEVVKLVEEGPNVAIYFRVQGRQIGKILGIAPTGKKATVDVMAMFTLNDEGLITSIQSVLDLSGLRAQLK